MKEKKAMALLLTAAMITGLAACQGQETQTSSGSSEGTPSLTALVVTSSLTEDVNGHQYLKDIAEEAGVTITWEQVPESSWADRKSTMLAGGEIPDLIVGTGSIDDADFAMYPGMFEDMTQLIEDYAPNIQKMFEEKPVMKTMATSLDGKIYGIPKYQRFWPLTANHQLINQQWLDNLGFRCRPPGTNCTMCW